jgi:hypothetical protein
MREANVSIDKNASIVRPAMMQSVSHLHEFCFIYLPFGAWSECNAADTAHIW